LRPARDSVVAVLAAGGRGERLSRADGVSKQFLLLDGKPIYLWSLETLCRHPRIDKVVVVSLTQMVQKVEEDIQKYFAPLAHKMLVTAGGVSRQESVFRGLEVLAKQTPAPDYVLVHDAARPFISSSDIDQLLETLMTCKGCSLAIPASDTIKRACDNMIIETIERNELYMVQTPQAADFNTLLQAHRQARQYDWQVTDDIALLEKIEVPVKIVLGSSRNFKITNEDDLCLAEALMQGQGRLGAKLVV
jgi:2-C-methyl-D-erythritol 4-phosphate cytidylyltransferase